jgi:hypothetical protein
MNQLTAMPPPHEDRDCHRPTRYVIKHRASGLFLNHRTSFGGLQWQTTTADAPTFASESEALGYADAAGCDPVGIAIVPLEHGVGGFDGHRPLPRYVIRTRVRGDHRDRFRAVFVGDLDAALREAEIAARERVHVVAHRYQRVELWCEDGCHQRIATWHYGRPAAS